MRYIVIITILFFQTVFLNIKAIALPDLIVTTTNMWPLSVAKYQTLTAQVVIKNSGNGTAAASYLGIYLSTDLTFDNAFLIGLSPVKTLGIGDVQVVTYKYVVPNSKTAGTYNLLFYADVGAQVPESAETNGYYYPNPLTISPGIEPNLKLNYPMLFIHGLASKSGTWDSLTNEMDDVYGLTFGGTIRFCLNKDNSLATSNLQQDVYDFTNPNALIAGDYYYLNFAINQNGQIYTSDADPNQSNQSAIYKQGKAVQKAIEYVLQKTGSDKVVLVGHSMGGLASRQYLQNSAFWQSDGQHHVAKLLTIGTPHGGSNSSLGGFLPNVNELSEGVRDLRTTYYTGPGNPGCFLFGGNESNSYMAGAASNFYNVDVNCNGVLGETIVGLNSKNIPTNLSYACVIGNGSIWNGGGDGVVSFTSANLNNFYILSADTFLFNKFTISGVFHNDIHQQLKPVMKGLDESSSENLAIEIVPNTLRYGFTTYRPNLVTADKDVYKINVTAPSQLDFNVYNLLNPTWSVSFYNASGSLLQTYSSFGGSNITFTRPVAPGVYYVHLNGTATNSSLYWPYAFEAILNPTTSIAPEITSTISDVSLFPNPVGRFSTLSFSTPSARNVKLEMINIQGLVFKTMELESSEIGSIQKVQLDFSGLPSGIYLLKLKTSDQVETIRFVVAE
jgi:pimeloyl-ACP methyl ester carboxylesterase